MNFDKDKQIILFSDPNVLASNILAELLKKGYLVNIVSDYKKQWSKRAENLQNRTNILITPIKNYLALSNFTCSIFCGGFIKKQSALKDFNIFLSNKNFNDSKVLAIFPFDLYPDVNKKPVLTKTNSGVIYVGDIFGESIDLGSDLLVPKLIRGMIDNRLLTLGVGELFSPVLVTSVAELIVDQFNENTFYAKNTCLMGNQTSSIDFWRENSKYFPKLKIIYNTKSSTRVFPPNKDTTLVNSNFKDLLNITYRWLVKNQFTIKKNSPKKSKTKSLKINIPARFKNLRKTALGLLVILTFPLFAILISFGFLFFSYKSLLANKIENSQKSALIAKTIFVSAESESRLLEKIPLLSKLYGETTYISYLGKDTSDLLVNIIPLVNVSETLVDNILGNSAYDIKAVSLQIKTGFDYSYQKISRIQIETDQNSNKGILSAKQVKNIVDFNKIKNLVQQGSVLVNYLPDILGQDSNKNYLTLFQNNMELRPTGGFIGSYGILDFGGGKLNGLTVNDIYSADGQLKGHIEPPKPIKDYLGEANWFFRDSNWNPDFSTSALRAEWFLNKEMGQKVNGTIAIDLTPIKKILRYTGPIFLPDYNLSVNTDNLYEKTQQESESNFFAGSRKKASFLTALSRVLVSEIPKLNTKQKLGILKSVYEGLEERSIQIHFNNNEIQDPIEKLVWNGGIPNYTCGDKCYSDFFADIEANVGVNKSNYFISRKIDFGISIDNKNITRKLNINLANSANMSLGASGIYKTYLRILIPTDVKLLESKVVNGKSVDDLKTDVDLLTDRQEVGVYVEILPGENKTISFSWTTNIDSDFNFSDYGLFVRKQAGTGNDPLGLLLDTKLRVLANQPVFTLTKQGVYTYNTTLNKDFFARVSFKN